MSADYQSDFKSNLSSSFRQFSATASGSCDYQITASQVITSKNANAAISTNDDGSSK